MEIIPDPYHVALLSLPFLATVMGLYFILWNPLLEWLEERDNVTRTARLEAEDFNKASEDYIAKIEARLAEAHREVSHLRQEARERASARETQIISDARAQADRHVQSAVGQLLNDKETARQSLQATAQELSTSIAARVLGRELG